MHYLWEVVKTIDKTHPRLGNPIAVAMLAIKAKKLLLLVSPRGCGKSRVTSFIALSHPEAIMQDRLSIAGLMAISKELEGFNGAIIVDDIAKTQTPYARITTLTTLAELVYSHYCISHLQGTHFEIRDFNGAALINIQPVLLREVVRSPEWEASMMDKSIRYYHLYRPVDPNPMPPDIKLEWGIDTKRVEIPELRGKLAETLMDIGEVQWGYARLKEHLSNLLVAAAALDNREKVIPADYRLLISILSPLRIEGLITDKAELESRRYLASNQLAILTEFVSYGNFTLDQLCRDYKISQSQAYKIMGKYSEMWEIVRKNPTTYAPTKELRVKLKEVGI